MSPVGGDKVLPLAMIQNGDTHVSALVPSGKVTPHATYYMRRERSVMGNSVPSLGELEAAIKPITLSTPLAGTHNERVTSRPPNESVLAVIVRFSCSHRIGNPGSTIHWYSPTREQGYKGHLEGTAYFGWKRTRL